MQQVVIKGRAYLHAYYVAREYGYAPAYIRELYDSHAVLGVFYKGTLYLDAVSFESYIEKHAAEAANARNHKKEIPADAPATVAEHRYLHHAKERNSRYEKDAHELWPQPKKDKVSKPPDKSEPTVTAAEAEPATPQPEDAPTTHSKRLTVTLADAEAVQVKRVGPKQTTYTPAERPPISYTGELVVEEAGDEYVAPLAAATDAAIPDETREPAPAADAKQLVPEEDTGTEDESEGDTKTRTVPWWRRAFGVQTMAKVAMLLLVLGLGSVLFLEQYTVVSEETVVSHWRISWQAALLLLSW